MPFQQHQSLRYWTFDAFQDQPVRQAVFTRQGGVSQSDLKGLNLSRSVGDDEANVLRNEELAFEAFGRPLETAADSYLEHGTRHIYATKGKSSRDGHLLYADILLTDRPDVTLFMRFGDCLPILYYDPVHHAVAMAHAGWRGTLLGVANEALAAMEEHFHTNPQDVIAAIGPGICVNHYEVGEEVIAAVQDGFDGKATGLLPQINGKTHFDLFEANRFLLEQAGVGQIEVSGLCTAEHLDDWFSHRVERGNTGRFGALLALEER